MKALLTSLTIAVILLGGAALFTFMMAQPTLAGAVTSGSPLSQQGMASAGQAVKVANVASLPAPLAATPTCAPSWLVVASPNPSAAGQQYGSAVNTLSAVSVVSPGDVWAVGYYNDPSLGRPASPSEHIARHSPNDNNVPLRSQEGVLRTLVEHWNGTAWSVVPSANNSSDDNVLLSTVALGANNVWAAGYYLNSFGVSQTLVQHWDGTSWSIVASPNQGALLDNELTAIDAVSDGDVWAVGYYYTDQAVAQTLVEHWNGTAWSIVASPNAGTAGNNFYSLTVISPSDVWAVGDYTLLSGYSGAYKSLAEHWNGTAWSIVATPGVGSFSNVFYGVDALSSNDVWAVGGFNSSNGGPRSLLEHWDGTAWTPVVGPTISLGSDTLYSVSAIATNDVWAVGQVGYDAPPQPLAEHWNGTAWTQVHTPSFSDTGYTALLSVDALTTNDLWAVGYVQAEPPYASQTLTAHYSTACVSCALSFNDVQAGSPFYAYVQCLACQGVVSGYTCADPINACLPAPVPSNIRSTPFATSTPAPTAIPGSLGYYRPGSAVTRGELAKIISNSSSIEENPGNQIFADVPPYSPFYIWINRLAHKGILGGYACGTNPQEPCDVNHSPYFRPGDNASRGQIAKIVSNARGFSDTVPPTQQSFTDVPPSSTFWLYIERLRLNGSVISGYSCGGAGEPCPGAYFRPQNNASRGQVAKMVSKAFFPNCYNP